MLIGLLTAILDFGSKTLRVTKIFSSIFKQQSHLGEHSDFGRLAHMTGSHIRASSFPEWTAQRDGNTLTLRPCFFGISSS